MLDFHSVTDTPTLFGRAVPLLTKVDFHLPAGRYALLSESPEYHRPLIDLLAGLRPPDEGLVSHVGRISWPIGRQGIVRGRATGQDLIDLVCGIYDMDPDYAGEVIATLISLPEYVDRPVEQWPSHIRQEFIFAIALLPEFDIYIVDAALPFESARFTRLWQALFEEKLVGKTLILTSYRQNQMVDYCAKALIYKQSRLAIDDDLEACIERYPARPSREEFGAGALFGATNEAGDLPY
jgi:capsular polysaccharide transport system ATP-binding protein